MKFQHFSLIKTLPLSLALAVVSLTACQIEREQRARLPDVDVQVSPGTLPEYDFEGPNVNVGVTERTVTVPKVIVIQEEETVEVPYVDVNLPGADKEERTVTTEVEVPSAGYRLDIEGIYAVNSQLWVVSRLKEVNPAAAQTKVRVSDRIVVNAPELPVRQFIIGERPQGNFNEQYTFISDRQEIASQLQAGRELYKEGASS